MANKSFEIQESKLRLGGVDLEAGNTGVVIPGVTRAASFRVEEVEDVRDQTYQFLSGAPVVIDAALYSALLNELPDNHFADFSVRIDDEGYIDEIKALGTGTYSQPESVTASTNDIYAYIGTGSASDRPIVPQDWIQIPFRPKMRAGNVETIGGGGGGTDTENVGFSNNVVQGSGWELGLSPGADFTSGEYTNFENGPEFGPQYFRVRGGDNYEHLHFDTTNNDNFDLYIGDDSKYVKVAKDGNIVISANDSNNYNPRHWTFGKTGGITFPDGSVQTTSLEPQLNKVDNKIQLKGILEMSTNPGGSVSTLDSDESTYVWFNSATGDSAGNKYTVGSDDNGNSFLISYNPDGSLRWKYTFNEVEINGNYSQVYPYTIKYNANGGGQFIYVGFDASNCTGASVFNLDGQILNTWAWSVNEGSSIDHYSLEVDSTTGNPIIAGRAYGEWNLFEGVPVIFELIEDGVLSMNRVADLNNITNVYPWNTNTYNIDIDGTGNWYQPSRINAFVGVPITTVTGVGGHRLLTGGTGQIWPFQTGALTIDNSGATPFLTITAADWSATADLNAILAHGVGQTYNLTLNVSDGSTFQTTGSWTETVPGTWTVEGTLTVLSGDPITTAVNVTAISHGTTALVNVYYRINDDGTSDYDSIEINTPGTGYAQGDQAVIPGELLGGTNLVSTTASAWITQGGPFSMSLIYAKSTYPDLGTTVQQGWLANGGGLFNAIVTSIDSIDYNGTTPAWSINLGVPASSYDGSSDVTFNNAGNDLTLTLYPDWNYAQLSGGRPIQNTVRFLMDQPLTGTNFNVRVSTGDQAFIITPNWYTTIGDSNNQEFTSISLDKTNNILYAIGDFNTPNQNDYPVIAIDYESGNIIWQKNFDDGTGWVGSASVIADGDNNCVYVPFENDNGQACILKLDSGGNLIWAVKLLDNNWDYRPQGAIDSNGDLILVGSYNIYNPTLDNWANEMFFTKLSKTDGAQLWANSLTRNISQRNDIYFDYDVDNNWVNIVNDVVYVGGYTRDTNNNYDVGLAVAVPADGSGLGDYQGWTYHAYSGDIGVNDIVGDMSFNNTSYENVNQLVITPMALNLSLASDQPNWSTYSTSLGSGSKVKFEDGSEQTTAGIARFSKDGGNTSRDLSADMNGKFLFYDNSNNYNNSWIYIPSNAEVELPVGFTVTVAIGNLNGYSIYVDNGGNGDVVIYHAGSSDGVNNYWIFGNDGNPGIYTIMKVDTNTWMLAGPSINVD